MAKRKTKPTISKQLDMFAGVPVSEKPQGDAYYEYTPPTPAPKSTEAKSSPMGWVTEPAWQRWATRRAKSSTSK
jgi:hypothetical protein